LHSDVLIVGAGSAGCVLAERLSQDSGCRVTVLESGPSLADPSIAALTAEGSVLPIGVASPVVRHYPSTLTGHPHRPVRLVRGAVVGGSGAINGGYFCRGLPRDFDDWALPGWAWSEVLDHYRAVETDLDFPGAWHGDSGKIPVRRAREPAESTAAFVQAARAAGHRWVDDLNGDPAAATGVGLIPLNIIDGIRVGPGAGYLRPALSRPNLTVLTDTSGWRIRIDAGRAVGVEAVGSDGDVVLTGDRIVLCAGAIGSAHLLMLSGVGDEAMLRGAGVAVRAALPVGQHCTDHPEWVLPTDWRTEVDRPVLEAVLSTDEDTEIRPYTGGFVTMMGDHRPGHPDWPHVGVALMKPRSRGRITLASAQPDVAPRIEHRYDSEPADVAALHRGAELARELCATRVGEPMWSTSQHLCGSAPMGADGDERAVLDPQCRVRGVEGLWVVDGSILPSITSRGPHATIVMAAHRAAEFVTAS
jgi:predicted dehydrogenase (TIGR03970 family)